MVVQLKVVVWDECVERFGIGGEKTSYHAKISDQNGNPLPENFHISLIMFDEKCSQTLATPYLYSDVYDPDTFHFKVSFEIPFAEPKRYWLKLVWGDQLVDTTPYEAGESSGIDFYLAEPRRLAISEESTIEPAGAPGQWVSYKAKIEDEFGNPLPEESYFRLFIYAKTPILIKLDDEYLGIATGTISEYRTIHRPIDPSYPVEIRLDGALIPSDMYSVDYEKGIIHFSEPPSGADYTCVNGICQWIGGKLTASYVSYTDRICVAGVNLVPDVYDRSTRKAQFAFWVPDFELGDYLLKLEWENQVVKENDYYLELLSGESNGTYFRIVPEAEVYVVNEWVELTTLHPGDSTSYHAYVYDSDGGAVPPWLPFRLKLGNNIVSRGFFSEDVYDPTTKEVAIAFQVPLTLPPGTYRVKLEWDECFSCI